MPVPAGTVQEDTAAGDSKPSPDETKDPTHQLHGRVGKKHRSKLNDKFESLRAVLRVHMDELETAPDPPPLTSPPAVKRTSMVLEEDDDDDDDDDDEDDGVARAGSPSGDAQTDAENTNKAKILDLARRRIEMLQAEGDRLRREKEALTRTLEAARRRVEGGHPVAGEMSPR